MGRLELQDNAFPILIPLVVRVSKPLESVANESFLLSKDQNTNDGTCNAASTS